MTGSDKARARIETLRQLGISRANCADPELDALAAHAAEIAETPVGLVTFVDEDRQWLAGEHGFGERETPLERSFCRHAIELAEAGLWVVGDALLEPLVQDNALVRADRPVRFYAGVIIETRDRVPLGAVCVLDYRPRTLDDRTERTLRLLAREVGVHLELKLARMSLTATNVVPPTARHTRPNTGERSGTGSWDPRHARFFYATPQPMWVFDVDTLEFLAVNDAAVQRYGWSREEFLRMTIREIRPPEDIATLEGAVTRSNEEPHSVGIWRHRTRSGEELKVEISSQPIEVDGRRARLTIAVDVTAKLEAESRLRTSEASLKLAQRIAHLGSWELDLESGGLTWSDETFRMFGYAPRAFLPTYAHFLAAVHPDDRARMEEAQAAVVAGLRPLDIEHRIVRTDGSIRWVQEVGELLRDAHGVGRKLAGTVLDITERHTTNARLTRINRLYRMLSRTNEAIIRTARLDELVDAVLRVAVEDGGFVMAAFVEVGPDGALLPLAVHGHEDGYFEERSVLASANVSDSGPIARALRSGRRELSNDLANDAESVATREVALRRGYRSKAAFPLYLSGEPPRALVFFARETSYFQDDELDLLNAVAEDVAHAAEVYRRDAQRARVESELAVTRRQTQLVFESVADGIHGIGRDGRILFENRAARQMFGRSAVELIGLKAHELIHHHRADGTLYPEKECPIHRTMEDGQTRHVEGEVFFDREGRAFPVEYICAPLTDDHGTIAGAVVSFRDVSERRLREGLETLEATVHQASVEERPLEEIAGLITRGLESLLPGVRAGLATRDPKTREFSLSAAPSMGEGFDVATHELLTTLPASALASVVSAETGLLVFESVATMRPLLQQAAHRFGFAATTTSPVVSDGEVRGLLTLFLAEERGPNQAERETLARTTRIFANVLERHLRHRALAEMASLVAMAGRLARVGGWTLELGSRSIMWSDEVAEIHEVPAGYRPTWEEALGFYAPEDRARAIEVFARAIQSGGPFDAELAIVSARGTRRAVRILGEPELDERRQVVAMRGAMQDITAQKRLEVEARVLAERLKNTIDSITDAFYVLSRDWRFTYVNAEAERQLERRANRLLGRVVWDEFPEVLGGPLETHYRHAMASGGTAHFEFFHAPLRKWFEVSAYPSSEGLAIHFRDVTERRALDARIREQAELIDRAQDAILVRDLEHYIRSWNKGAERLYGWTAEEAVGQSIKAMLYDDTTVFTRATEEVIELGEWTGELEQVTRDGRRVTVMARWSLVRDTDGKPLSVLAINTDITEKKKLEQNLLRAQRLESIGTLAGGIAHDLNNVLAPILMVVSALAAEETDPERREDFETIERSAERGAYMVRQLLVFARGHGGQMSNLQLEDIASDVARMMRDTLPKNIGVRLELAPDLWEVYADPTQMHQVLTNLCVNARDAMPLGGLLTIALEPTVVDEVYAEMHLDARPGAYLLLRVEDTGTGMTPEILERMFEPFFTTKDIGKGTGLGLSTVHAIVRGHRGFINVYSEVGKGTRFRIYLPANPPESQRAEVAEAQVRLPRGHGELILIVDDEELIRNVASRTLERNGYRTLTAANGAEAIAAFVTHREEIALVLTDMAMPVMDGPATIVALRAMEPRLRIIGSSGLNANGNVVRAMDAGVRHFVPKPYTTEGLLRVLHRALSEDG